MIAVEQTERDGVPVGILYRPTGQREMDRVEASGFQKWPPRLPEQPIFYPVTNEAYAKEIASKWNTKDARNGCVGYVTRFFVRWDFLQKFHVEVVGAATHSELWIPAEELEDLNASIVGAIEVVEKVTA